MRWCLFGDNLIGDQLMTTPAIRSRKLAHPEDEILYFFGSEKGTYVMMDGNPYLDKLEVIDGINHDNSGDVEKVSAEYNADRVVLMKPAIAFNYGVQNQTSLCEGFGSMLDVTIDSLKYDYYPKPEELEEGKRLVEEVGEGKPVVIIARHSASCSSNDPRVGTANKCVSNKTWVQVADWLLREGFVPVAVGSKKELDDGRYSEWPGKKLYGYPLRTVAGILKAAAGTLSVDTGIRHLAAAVGGNEYCISGAIPLGLIRCEAVIEGQRIHEDHRPLPYVTTKLIVDGAKKILM